ncbi:MAG: hypothetical protein ACOCV1_08360, partial [Bacillota bacterium]
MKIKTNKFIFIFLTAILFLSFVSAEGLEINQNTFNLNKTYDQNTVFEFIITNTESFDFVNISFEDNDFVKMDEIVNLSSGANATIIGTIYGNEDLSNEKISLEGYYEGEYGEGDVTHQVTINDNGEVNLGDFSAYVGDKINFTNNRDGDIFLKISDSDGEKIKPEENFVLTINNADDFEYYFYDSVSFNKVSNVYTVTALPTKGLITNPEFNPELIFDLEVNYPKTQIELKIDDEKEFIVKPFETTDLILSVKNTGDNVAKEIRLEGDWISFSANNFDLNPGQSKGIIATISPTLQNTNDTDKNYTKTIQVKGNFDTQTEDLDIYIPYTEIREGEFTEGQTF